MRKETADRPESTVAAPEAPDAVAESGGCARFSIFGSEQINAELRDNERHFRAMFEALPAAVFATDAGGRLTHFNPAAADLSGRMPPLGTNEWLVSWKLYRADGTPLPHKESPW